MTPYTTGAVASKDGATIGYRQLGAGPGLVLVHGGMNAAQNLMRLATLLADTFTVYMPDRRGRGVSDPHGDGYGIEKECEDLEALLAKTDAHCVFGHSAGAIVSLKTALKWPAIERLAVYEPPLSTNGSTPTDWIIPFDRQVAAGKVSAALVTALKGGQMSSALMNAMPSALLGPLLSVFTRGNDRNLPPGDVPIRDLIPTMHFDVQLVREMENTTTSFAAVKAKVLLLGGSNSASYLRDALDRLAAALPQAERVELPRSDHIAPDNNGRPELVAAALRRFFV
jgi:pimeloyl-ACP methyl ester carboxylesterase